MDDEFVEGVTLLPDITCDDEKGHNIGLQAVKEILPDLLPIKYQIPWPEQMIDRTYYISARINSKTGETKWVIEEMGHVINKETGMFEYEPMPSSRTEEFIKNTRFDSVEEAYEWFKADLRRQNG